MFYIEGRKVRVLTGQPGRANRARAQTVNICTKDNQIGQNDYVLRLYSPHFTSEDELRKLNFRTVEDCVTFLQKEYNAKIERSPSGDKAIIQDATITKPAVVKLTPPSLWDEKCAQVVEETIDQFILEFLEFPYLHRCEHSIHCELYKLLTERRLLSSHYPMGKWFSQLVHKEWPEISPRPNKYQRGTIDLCIISPEQLKNCSVEDFINGRINPLIAIEIGLDDDQKHLKNDLNKLSNSMVNFGYVIHLVRCNFSDDFNAVEKLILGGASKVKTAYGRLTGHEAFYKLTNDKHINSIKML